MQAVERFDAIVVGAGPAGSTTAHRLARSGARVLLVDKARFPRDKPCGGGLTLRAVRQLPDGLDVEQVVEHVVDRMELRLRYGTSFERGAAPARAPERALPTARGRRDEGREPARAPAAASACGRSGGEGPGAARRRRGRTRRPALG